MSEDHQNPQEEQQDEQQDSQEAAEWYIQVGEGKKAGPISFERLQNFAERGKIFSTTNIRSTLPDAAWMPARSVPGLFDEEKDELEDSALPETDVSTEPSSDDAIAVSDDSQSTKIPRVLIDVGRNKDEKPKEKKSGSKTPAFVIDTAGGASKKNTEEPADAVDDTPSKEPVKQEEKSDGSTVASSPGIKISIGGSNKKDSRKDVKKEKSSAGFKFSIDPTVSKKKEEKSDDSAVEPPSAEAEPIAEPTPAEKKKDASSPGIKISIGTPAGKKKDGEKSSEKSASAFKVAVKPSVAVEPDVEEKKKSDESSVITRKSKSKQRDDEENTDDSTDFELKKPKSGGGAILKIIAVFSVVLAFGGAIALIVLGKETPGIVFSALLGGVVFLYGIMTGILAWSLGGIVSTKNE